MSFRKVLAIGPIALVQVWHSVQAHAVNTHAEPEIDHRQQAAPDVGAFKIQIRLVMIKPVPVILIRKGIPRPVGGLEVFKYDARFSVFLGRVIPHIELASGTSGPRPSRALEPGMLIRGVVQHEFRNHPNAAPVSLAEERSEVIYCTV